MLLLCSTLLPLMIFFSGVSLVLLIPGSKPVFQLSFIFIKMEDMVSAWAIPIEPVIVGSMHLYTGWMLMGFFQGRSRNNLFQVVFFFDKRSQFRILLPAPIYPDTIIYIEGFQTLQIIPKGRYAAWRFIN